MIKRLMGLLAFTVGMAILLAVILGLIAVGNQPVILMENMRWVAFLEFIGFCCLAGYAIGLILRIYHSTGHQGGHCVFCGGKLTKAEIGSLRKGVHVLS